jgi:hypothetical protein
VACGVESCPILLARVTTTLPTLACAALCFYKARNKLLALGSLPGLVLASMALSSSGGSYPRGGSPQRTRAPSVSVAPGMSRTSTAGGAAAKPLLPFTCVFITGGSGFVGRRLLRYLAYAAQVKVSI